MGCCGWSHKRQSKTILPTTYVGCEQICHVSRGMSRFKSLKTAVATDNALLCSDLTFWQIHRWRPAWFLVEKEQMRDIKKNWQHDLIPWPHNHFGMAPFCSSPPNSAFRFQNSAKRDLSHFQFTFVHKSRFPIHIWTQLKIQDFSHFQFTFEHNSSEKFWISQISSVHLHVKCQWYAQGIFI